MHFSLDLPVTENQISAEVCCFYYNLKREETAWPLPFSKCYNNKKRLQLTFVVYYSLNHWPVTGLSTVKNISMRQYISQKC